MADSSEWRKVIDNPKISDVVDAMVQFALAGSTSPKVRDLVETICREITSGDYASEILSCYYWCCQSLRYMRDIEVAEYVRDPQRLLKATTGDCDDIAVFLAAMLISCGNKCSFILAAFNGSPMPSHVFVGVHTPKGIVPLDPVANVMTDKMLASASKKWVIPINGAVVNSGAW